MDPRALSDRAEICDAIVRYTRAVDTRRWDDLDALFAPGAHVDYTAFGGPAGCLSEIKEFLASAMTAFSSTQHMVGLPDIRIEGDRARAVTPCHNPMLMGSGPGSKVMVCSLWYHHELIRTPAGWRIARLSEQRNFMTVLPTGDVTP